jgi:hypothetical protein
VTLADIEIAFLERVQYGLKQFGSEGREGIARTTLMMIGQRKRRLLLLRGTEQMANRRDDCRAF